ncbi:MAG: UdgX family uracil-DNA binding protein [Nocardioidaceae bacterium]
MTPHTRSSRPRGAEPYLPRDQSLAALSAAVDGCRGCELYHDTTGAVFGSGSLNADLVLVGEQPGDQEDRQGEPFVGPAGRLLDRALSEARIEPEQTYRTNAVKHFRHSVRGKRRLHQTPDLSHMVACSPWLEAELIAIEPRGIVLLGSSAGKAIFGGAFRLKDLRGGPHEWPDAARLQAPGPPPWLVVTTHPSAVLRAKDERDTVFEALVADLELARSALADTR